MEFNLFGLRIQTPKSAKKVQKSIIKTPIDPENTDGSSIQYDTAGGYAYGETISIYDDTYKSEKELINKYRKAVKTPEVDSAVDEIINDAIITDDNDQAVTLTFRDNTEISDNLKTKINEEFSNIYSMLNFQEFGYDYFRNWYIDGKIAFFKNTGDNQNQIVSMQPIDPLKIRKIKRIKQEEGKNGVPKISDIETFYEYSSEGFGKNVKNAIRLTGDSVTYITSGLLDENKKHVLSHLHKALKPINQLNMIEDAIVIYRISRAPERRIFYIDVGNLPRQKSEQYVKDIMNRYRNKLIYNPQTGEIDDTRKYQTMLEDYWLPRRDGCLSLDTKISMLDGNDTPLREVIERYKNGEELWTYSVDRVTGEIVPGLVSWAGVTRKNTKVLDVHLDNGEVVTATLDHKFILRNGDKIEAQYLKSGDSLMPFNKEQRPLSNHKVTKVVFRDDKMDVGTLTIDENHIYHDHHNFALSTGIFVMNSRGTSVETLPGGQSMNQIDDLEYFLRKVYKSLNVPFSRFTGENPAFAGRATEITREELKFDRFVQRLRNKFSYLFKDPLRTQLVLKKIVTLEEWEGIKHDIYFDFNKDSYFAESKQFELLQQRLGILRDMNEYLGKYFSKDYIMKNLLFMSDDEIKSMEAQIEKEKKAGKIEEPEEGGSRW